MGSAFCNTHIKSVVLPSKLKEMWGTFSGCSNLTSVELNEGLEEINYDCFSKTGIETIKIPSSLKILGDRVFCDCKYLKQVDFPECGVLDQIGKSCFAISGIEQITIPNYVKTLCENAFSSCEKL